MEVIVELWLVAKLKGKEERRVGRMGGRWEGREGGRHREEEEQHKGREVRKAQNELHVHVYSVPDMYMYMLVCTCMYVRQCITYAPSHVHVHGVGAMCTACSIVHGVPDLFPSAEHSVHVHGHSFTCTAMNK